MAADWRDATAMAAAVRNGEVSAVELTEAAVARIEASDGPINAVIHRRYDAALAEAAAGPPNGTLKGVPLLIKDLGAPSKGDPRHDGMAVLARAGWVSDHDAAVVRRLRDAGAIVVGRTNVPELGSTVTTEPAAHGPTRNPWDLSRSAGGSSGGSAAAVAAGMVPVAHATDGGGSIRIPASNCGLVGLKPSRGRVSMAPDKGEGWMGGSVSGAVTRTVRDAALVLDVLAGAEPGDPYAAPALPGPLVSELGADPGRLRIGLLDHPAVAAKADPDATAAARAGARLLEGLGHRVEDAWPVALAEPDYQWKFVSVVAVGVAADLAEWEQRLGVPIADEDIEPTNAALRRIGRQMSGPDYVATTEWLRAWGRRVAEFWAGGFDLLVTPVLNGPPPPIGWLTDREHGTERLNELMHFTSQWNMTGQPAISLPLHATAAGLPLGVQLVAAYGREGLLIRVAAQLEAAAPWDSRHPGEPVRA